MYKILRKFFFQFDPEKIHDLVFSQGKLIQKSSFLKKNLKTFFLVKDPALKQNFLDREFINPVGLAAGFDKNGELLPLFDALGFAFSEIGSISALESIGNPKPRLFRLPSENAIINRMGLNNIGALKASEGFKKISPIFWKSFPVGINISKTHSPKILGDQAINDFITSYNLLKDFSHYITINISCPNTSEGKTFESNPEELEKLLQKLSELKKNRYILLKLSNDLCNIETENIIKLSMKYKIDGFVISNTSTNRKNLKTSPEKLEKIGNGGLSGSPIKDRSTELIKKVYTLSKGELPIIGVGGITTGQDAYDKILAGATLIQVLTGLIYEGPFIAKKINIELIKLLKKDGYQNIKEAMGQGVSCVD